MGCCGSSPGLPRHVEAAATSARLSGDAGEKAAEKTELRMISAMHTSSFLDKMNTRARKAFDKAAKDSTFSPDELANMVPDLPANLRDAFFALLDHDQDGLVSVQEFLMTLALLKDGNRGVSGPVDTCFAMFDMDNSGSLSSDEFRTLIKLAVGINLKHLLATRAGQEGMTSQLAREHAEENIQFWKATKAYREAPDAERVEAAAMLISTYVKEGADLQVNLSSSQAATAIAAVDEAEKAGTPPPPDLFDASQDEIFHLMERDTYPRFKSDPSQVSKLADQFFSQVDADGSNSVSYSEYRKWAMSEPIVIVFFRGLVDVGNHIMKAMDIEHQGVQEEHAPAPTTEADAKI